MTSFTSAKPSNMVLKNDCAHANPVGCQRYKPVDGQHAGRARPAIVLHCQQHVTQVLVGREKEKERKKGKGQGESRREEMDWTRVLPPPLFPFSTHQSNKLQAGGDDAKGIIATDGREPHLTERQHGQYDEKGLFGDVDARIGRRHAFNVEPQPNHAQDADEGHEEHGQVDEDGALKAGGKVERIIPVGVQVVVLGLGLRALEQEREE